MKKVYLLFLLAILPFVVYADPEKIDGIYYNLDLKAKTAEVTNSYIGCYSGEVVIPKRVTFKDNVYKVTSIGSCAFFLCSGLTSVTIPNSVTSIEQLAFSGCSGLTSVTIPSSVTSIGYSAFSGCTGLTSITFPASVTSIGLSAFDNTPWYNNQPDGIVYVGKMVYKFKGTMPDGKKIKIKDGTLGILDNAFYYCSGLTSVTIPNSVTSIGSGTFDGCSGLTSIIVEESNTVYDSRNNCNAIIETASNTLIVGCKNTIIPNSVTGINGAFAGCSGLTSITIPNSVTSIGDRAFNSCSGLTSITIPNSVTSIGGGAFNSCSGLTSITIPASVTSIGNGAFSYCSKLTTILVEKGNTVYDSRNCNAIIESASNTLIAGCQSTIIPNSVTSIGDWAFNGCGLTSITIPNSVTSIGDFAFDGCSGLSSITIPSSVTSIGSRVFDFCDRLTGVYSYAENVPTTNTDAFGGLIIDNVTLFVPAGSIEAYQAAEPWSGFKEIVGFTGRVKLSKSKAAVEKGKTMTLKATVTLPEKSVTWKSSNTKVATVTSTGKVKGVKAGTATITCASKVSGAKATCKVTVGYVTLDKSEAFVKKGKTVTLKPTVYPSSLEDKSVTWTSSDKSIATVSSSGKVKGVGYGTATITCTSVATGISATCQVTIGKVVLNTPEFTLRKTRTLTLVATLYPTTLTDKSVTWKSSDTKVATVSSSGKVKGIGAGTATITCTSNATGLKGTCIVTVLAVSESRSIEGDDDDATGIDEVNVEPTEVHPFDVYDLSGRKVAHQVTTLEGLPDGIYIVNGKKMLKK